MAERRSRGLGFGFGWGRRPEDAAEPAAAPPSVASTGQTGESQPQPPRPADDVAPNAEPVPTEGSVSLEPARSIEPRTGPEETTDTGVERSESPVWEGGLVGEPDDETEGWRRRRRPPREPADRRFPGSDEARLLCRIQEAEFRAIDWMLAADLRPNDRETLDNYNQAARQARELMDEYEERFGAFMWMHTDWPARRHTGPFAVDGEEYFEEEPA